MKKYSYNEFVEVLNTVIDKPIEDNEFWNINDIIKRNKYFGVNFLGDSQFRIIVDCKSEQAINELHNLLKDNNFKLENPYDCEFLRRLSNTAGIEYECPEGIIFFEEEMYSFAFYPTNEDFETYYMFLENYLPIIKEISDKYQTGIVLNYDQLDDVITGALIVDENGISTSCRIYSEMYARHLYIAACMLRQLAKNQEELDELFGEIILQNMKMIVIDANNKDEKENQEILKLIESKELEPLFEMNESNEEQVLEKVDKLMNTIDHNYI